eukprot:349984-Chlamydomonas_euryale.AAC.3
MLGREYYPKLQACVPFTPCTGPRLMVAGDLAPAQRRRVLLAMGRGLIKVAESSKLSSVHVTFNTAEVWVVAVGRAGVGWGEAAAWTPHGVKELALGHSASQLLSSLGPQRVTTAR